MKKTDDILREDADVFEMLSEWGAWAVVAGVVAEIWYAIQFHEGKSLLQNWLPVAASSLIALGVIIEIWAARKTKDAQGELDRRSNERVAELEFATGFAQKRAAELENESAQARRETALLMAAVAGRRISPENLALFTHKLSEFPAGAIITYVQGDPESLQLAAQIHLGFKNATWRAGIRARAPAGAATGIWVLSNGTPGDRTMQAVSIASEAFGAIGLPFQSSGGPSMSQIGDQWGPNTPPVHVIVGSKDPATFA